MKDKYEEAFRMIIFIIIIPIVWLIMGINILFHSIGILFMFAKDKINRGY
tara:strand:+ start:266 stop:415 length:150 start_codon:yes stop_codon:yes gene_type:complete